MAGNRQNLDKDALVYLVEQIVQSAIDSVNESNAYTDDAVGTLRADVVSAKIINAATVVANGIEANKAAIAELAARNINAVKIVADGLEANKANITDLVTENLQVGAINGNVIQNGTVIAKALSNEAIETVSGCKVYYSPEEPDIQPSGNRNLVIGYREYHESQAYLVHEYNLAEDWAVGQTYTCTIKGSFVDGGFRVWMNGSNTAWDRVLQPIGDGLYSLTFTPQSYPTTSKAQTMRIYNYPSSATHDSKIEWIKLEKGSSFTGYEPLIDKDGHIMRDGDTWYKTLYLNKLDWNLYSFNSRATSNGLTREPIGETWKVSGTANSSTTSYADSYLYIGVNKEPLLSNAGKWRIKVSPSIPTTKGEFRVSLSNASGGYKKEWAFNESLDFDMAQGESLRYIWLRLPNGTAINEVYQFTMYHLDGDGYNEVCNVWEDGAWKDYQLDGSILRANSVTAQEIAANTITANKIAANTITANKINLDDLQANIARIGKTNSRYVLIDASGTHIKDGASELAAFSANKIELGKNSPSAVIELCGGEAQIKQGPVSEWSATKIEQTRPSGGISLYTESQDVSDDEMAEAYCIVHTESEFNPGGQATARLVANAAGELVGGGVTVDVSDSNANTTIWSDSGTFGETYAGIELIAPKAVDMEPASSAILVRTDNLNINGKSLLRRNVSVSDKNTSKFNNQSKTCYAYPALGFVLFRGYVNTSAQLTAGTEYPMFAVSDYIPEYVHALSITCSKDVDAYVNRSGEVIALPRENVAANYTIRVTGFWII